MTKLTTHSFLVPLALGLAVSASAQSVAGSSQVGNQKAAAPAPAWVAAQQTTPGVAQSAHSNITGTSKAGGFEGSGAGLTNLSASALTTGTVSDSRLSANVLLSSAIQTITGLKTFSKAPVFSDAAVPFQVSSGNKVVNLNADKLDGLDSSAFLQAIPAPLNISDPGVGWAFSATSVQPGAVAAWASYQSSSNVPGMGLGAFSNYGTGLRGESLSGTYPGVSGISQQGAGVIGWGAVNGVEGATTNPGGSGVYGENYSGGFGLAGRGTTGVFGEDNSFNGGYGVAGYGATGVLGLDVEMGLSTKGVLGYSDFGYGVYGKSPTGIALYSEGRATIAGDLTVTGSKFGYVVDLVRNVDSVPLETGAVVEIVGHEPAIVGTIPVTLVRNATSARASAVLGPIDCAVALESRVESVEAPPSLGETLAAQHASTPAMERTLPNRTSGSVAPGGYGNVVTLGAFRAVRVDASYGAVRAGDMLVASPNPGYAMVSHDPRMGTVVGKALGDWPAGLGEVPVMVSNR